MSVRALYRSVRMAILRRLLRLKGVHRTFYLVWPAVVSRDLRAGEYSFVNRGCSICPKVTLGKYVMLAPDVAVVGGDHRIDLPGVPIIFAGRPSMPSTVLEDDVWVGYGARIIAGTRIGRGAVVAAGAVVTRDVPPYAVVGGVPARVLRYRFEVLSQRVHDAMLAGATVRGEHCGEKEMDGQR